MSSLPHTKEEVVRRGREIYEIEEHQGILVGGRVATDLKGLGYEA